MGQSVQTCCQHNLCHILCHFVVLLLFLAYHGADIVAEEVLCPCKRIVLPILCPIHQVLVASYEGHNTSFKYCLWHSSHAMLYVIGVFKIFILPFRIRVLYILLYRLHPSTESIADLHFWQLHWWYSGRPQLVTIDHKLPYCFVPKKNYRTVTVPVIEFELNIAKPLTGANFVQKTFLQFCHSTMQSVWLWFNNIFL